MLIRRRGVLAVFAVVLFVGGCANSSAVPPSSSGRSDPSSSSSSSSLASPSPSSSAQAISGTVAEGVEPNCLLLRGDGKPHLLVFADPALKSKAIVGAKVTVVGTAKPAQMTTCQQGTPFLVTSLTVDRPGA
jgi:hypothetical protein